MIARGKEVWKRGPYRIVVHADRMQPFTVWRQRSVIQFSGSLSHAQDYAERDRRRGP